MISRVAREGVGVEKVQKCEMIIPGERSNERHVSGAIDVVGDERQFVIAARAENDGQEHLRDRTHVNDETEDGCGEGKRD